MTDNSSPNFTDSRSLDSGSKSDRKISTSSAAALGAGASLAIGFTDWFFQCYSGGDWTFAPPNQQLIEMGAPIMVLPAGLWISRVMSLIGDIVINSLQRDADKK